MPDKLHHSADPRAELLALYRKATQELGLGVEHSVCRDIEHLNKHWNDAIYNRVRRALENYQTAKEAFPCVGDRIPPADAFTGELVFAVAPTPHGTPTPVRISPDRLNLHTIIAGLPGSGKTFLCRLLLALILALRLPIRVLLFDPNRSYQAFCSDPTRWLSMAWHELKLNPLVPPASYPEDLWVSETLDLFGRGELLHSRYLLARRLDNLFKAARARASSSEPLSPPSLFDLRDDLVYLRCRPGSKDELYRQSALNVLDGRLRTSGSVYNCACGMESLLTDTRCRIGTEGLAPVETLDFFVTNLVHHLCRRRATEPLVEPPVLHTLIVIEEAQTILEQRKDNISFYQELLLRARSLGVGFVFIAQDIHRIDPTVLAACSNLFVFSQSSAENKRTCRNALDLSPRESSLLGSLGVGECFIRFLGHPKWPYPFVARVPDVRPL